MRKGKPTQHWTPHDLDLLRRLRKRFLAADSAAGDYWQSATDLELYDATFGERIGWKWDAVLRELMRRGWEPRSRHIFDFGCGSGVASRRVLSCWPQRFESLVLYDRSPLATAFAAQRAREERTSLEVRVAERSEALPKGTLLVISHVLNELPSFSLAPLLTLAQQAQEILWVEAGALADSRRLISEVREPLLAGGFEVVGPCTHQAFCGMVAAENARHWCHSFAAVPAEAFQSAQWAELSRELGIDLRALPYSFLVLQRRGSEAPMGIGFSRIIGRPRDYKGYSKILSCQAEGVDEFTLQKRDAPALLRGIQKDEESLLFRWTLEDGKIRAGEGLGQDQIE